jgi:hypothetical protein
MKMGDSSDEESSGEMFLQLKNRLQGKFAVGLEREA